MEPLSNCKICGMLFHPEGLSEICNNCLKNDQDDFVKIREFLYKHPHSSIYEVATALNISINKIKHYLREERIEIVEEQNMFLKCDSCGKPIRSGWFCADCLKSPHKEQKISDHSGMHPRHDNLKDSDSKHSNRVSYKNK